MNESYKPEFIELKRWLKNRKFEDPNLIPARFPGKVWHSTLMTFLTCDVGTGDRKAEVTFAGGLCSLWEHILYCVCIMLPALLL